MKKNRKNDGISSGNLKTSLGYRNPVCSQRVKNILLMFTADQMPPELRMLNPFTPNGRIVGGESVEIEEAPHQVSLQYYGFGFCGGTIISDEWILTAAHCAVYKVEYVNIRAGTNRMTSGGSIHPAKEFIIHEKYTTNIYGIPLNDVALIKLSTPLKVDTTRNPIKLFDMNEKAVAGSASIITGWGSVHEGGSVTEILNKVSVPVVTKKACSKAYSSFGGVPSGQICAAYPEGGKDACQGDSGGPLTIGGRLAGIVSWGNGCARRGYPGVYTEVATYRDWIQEKTGL